MNELVISLLKDAINECKMAKDESDRLNYSYYSCYHEKNERDAKLFGVAVGYSLGVMERVLRILESESTLR